MFLSTFKISTLHVMIVVYARRSKQHVGDSRRITVRIAAGGTVRTQGVLDDFSVDFTNTNSVDCLLCSNRQSGPKQRFPSTRRVGRYFGGAYVIEFGGASELAV